MATGTAVRMQFINPTRGRGAVSNLQGRHEKEAREMFHDGWDVGEEDAGAIIVPRTTVIEEQARSILSRNASPDIPFGVSMNPYRGCEHGM